MCKFSVIVPVFKVENVLSKCIESILNQTFTDFELILIDDGSPDRSGAICDEYAAKDSRIHVIHQENAGVSNARNAGLDIAQGEYIVFVDSDDWVDSTFLEVFSYDDDDMIISCFTVFQNDGTIKETTFEENKSQKISCEEDVIAFLKKWYAIQVTGKRFKRKLINENNLRFNGCFNYGEDSIFVAQYLVHTHTIKTKSNLTYNICRIRDDSLTELANMNWFQNYTRIQEYLYYYFHNFLKIQTFLAQKYCWLAENELVRICNSNCTRQEMNHAIRNVLHAPHLSTCTRFGGGALSAVTRFLFWIKLPPLIRYLYTRHKAEE